MRNLLTLLGGICLVASSVGCCCLNGLMPYHNGCAPYGGFGNYGTGACQPGQCAPTTTPIYPQTGYNTYSVPQTSMAPTTYYTGYSPVSVIASESLPTY